MRRNPSRPLYGHISLGLRVMCRSRHCSQCLMRESMQRWTRLWGHLTNASIAKPTAGPEPVDNRLGQMVLLRHKLSLVLL